MVMRSSLSSSTIVFDYVRNKPEIPLRDILFFLEQDRLQGQYRGVRPLSDDDVAAKADGAGNQRSRNVPLRQGTVRLQQELLPLYAVVASDQVVERL